VSTDSAEKASAGIPTVNGKIPDWLREVDSFGADRATVAALCEKFSAVCESAVDPLEVASALEFDGFSDNTVKLDYGVDNVFALARAMYRRVPRRPAPPAETTDPWQMNKLRPLLHGLLYALPAVCFPAAAGLLNGPGVLPTLVVALLVAWGLAQGLAALGYLRRAGSADENQVRQVLQAGLAAGSVLVALAMLACGLVLHARSQVLLFGAGEGVYMLGACVLMVVGAETWLPLALVPGVVGSGVFLYLGRPAGLEHLAWAVLAATPVLACAIAVVCSRSKGRWTARLLDQPELLAAVPAIAFGVIAAGLLTFPVVAGPQGHGGLNAAALLASLPLSLSMGAAEWSLLWYRRRTRTLLGSTSGLAIFRTRSRGLLLTALGQYMAGTAVLIALGALVAGWTGLAHPGWGDLPEMAGYLMLGSAMFLALLLQTVRVWAVPLLIASVGLAAELILHNLGVTVQVLTPAVLLVAIGCFAVLSLGAAVRHG
jgi:hypothetical protein